MKYIIFINKFEYLLKFFIVIYKYRYLKLCIVVIRSNLIEN